VAALEALELPAEIRGGVDSAKPDIRAFGDFGSTFVGDAQRDRAGATARESQIAERNTAVDERLTAVHKISGVIGKISDVASASAASTDAMAQARDSSAEVARGAEKLRGLVGQFRVEPGFHWWAAFPPVNP
jgi:hypothetical protein